MYILNLCISILDSYSIRNDIDYVYTPVILKAIVQMLDFPFDFLKKRVIDFLMFISSASFHNIKRILDFTTILNHIEDILINDKFDINIRYYLLLLNQLTKLPHSSYASHLDLWKWVLNSFIRCKENFKLIKSIVLNFDTAIGKSVLSGLEKTFYKKLEKLFTSEKVSSAECGLKILVKAIEIDDYYIDSFIEDNYGLDIIYDKLNNKKSIKECLSVITALSKSRDIYRELLIDNKLFDWMLSTLHSSMLRRLLKECIFKCLASFFVYGNYRQVIKIIDRGALEVMMEFVQDNKSKEVFEDMRRVLKKSMMISKNKKVKQNIFELRAFQTFNKMIEYHFSS